MPFSHPTPASMNYANMIDEKNLKKTFIVATLISTIIGTFTTSINLYERVAERRQQKKTDHGQDEKIKALEKRIDEKNEEKKLHERRADDLKDSLQGGGPLIRREYDQDVGRLGPRFAQGDLTAQTQLQGQIITLQGTVIKLLEEALLTGRPPDINKLYNASEFARDGSIRALRDQYQRMLMARPMQRPMGPVRRISSTPALRGRAFEDGPSNEVARRGGPPEPLYCPYAEELQETERPLDVSFANGGSSECPDCGAFIPVEEGRSWKIDKQVVRETKSRGRGYDEVVEVAEDRTYRITNRFLVKCHREGEGFACYLCYQFRDTDTLCRTVESLVAHVSKRHNVREYENEADIRPK